jgi:hypothetical protein
MSHHFRLSNLDLNYLNDSLESLRFWETKTLEFEDQLKDSVLFEKRYDIEEKWAVSSKRRDEVQQRYNVMLHKIVALNQWAGHGCMGATITRTMLEIACFFYHHEFPSRKPRASSRRGWTDNWDERIDFELACQVIDLGLLKPKHGDAFWWLEKTDNIHRVLFWHELKGIVLPDTSLPDRPGEVSPDFLDLKKAGAYRDFIPPLKRD